MNRGSLKTRFISEVDGDDSENLQKNCYVAEKKLELFRRQKDLLDTFLATGAISQPQNDKSLSCLIEKMGIKEEDQ